eukprot:gene18710-22380_t
MLGLFLNDQSAITYKPHDLIHEWSLKLSIMSHAMEGALEAGNLEIVILLIDDCKERVLELADYIPRLFGYGHAATFVKIIEHLGLAELENAFFELSSWDWLFFAINKGDISLINFIADTFPNIEIDYHCVLVAACENDHMELLKLALVKHQETPLVFDLDELEIAVLDVIRQGRLEILKLLNQSFAIQFDGINLKGIHVPYELFEYIVDNWSSKIEFDSQVQASDLLHGVPFIPDRRWPSLIKRSGATHLHYLQSFVANMDLGVDYQDGLCDADVVESLCNEAIRCGRLDNIKWLLSHCRLTRDTFSVAVDTRDAGLIGYLLSNHKYIIPDQDALIRIFNHHDLEIAKLVAQHHPTVFSEWIESLVFKSEFHSIKTRHTNLIMYYLSMVKHNANIANLLSHFVESTMLWVLVCFVESNYNVEAACQAGNIEIVKLLYSKIDHKQIRIDLRHAMVWNHLDIVRYLMDNGETTEFANANDQFHTCGAKGYIDMLGLFLNDQSTITYNPHDLVKQWSPPEVKRILFKNILSQAMEGALEAGNLETVNMLIYQLENGTREIFGYGHAATFIKIIQLLRPEDLEDTFLELSPSDLERFASNKGDISLIKFLEDTLPNIEIDYLDIIVGCGYGHMELLGLALVKHQETISPSNSVLRVDRVT